MKLLVEILKKNTYPDGLIGLELQKERIVDFGTDFTKNNIDRAKAKIQELRTKLSNDYIIRVIEYHNDEDGNKDRKPCNILFESN